MVGSVFVFLAFAVVWRTWRLWKMRGRTDSGDVLVWVVAKTVRESH
jgi:hypothetical protein